MANGARATRGQGGFRGGEVGVAHDPALVDLLLGYPFNERVIKIVQRIGELRMQRLEQYTSVGVRQLVCKLVGQKRKVRNFEVFLDLKRAYVVAARRKTVHDGVYGLEPFDQVHLVNMGESLVSVHIVDEKYPLTAVVLDHFSVYDGAFKKIGVELKRGHDHPREGVPALDLLVYEDAYVAHVVFR